MKLKEYQKILYEILVEFDAFCSKNNLRYTLFGGTLLGAIRHNGFIPWDDDLDVAMPREDYERFLSLYHDSEVYTLLKPGMSEYFYPFAKLCNRNFPIKEIGRKGSIFAFIDIFPFDRIEIDKKVIKTIEKLERKILVCGQNKPHYYKSKSKFKSFILPLYLTLEWLFRRKRKIEKYITRLNKLILDNSANDGLYKFVIWNRNYSIAADFDRPLINHRFEKASFSIVKDFDIMLTNQYGDYMTPPKKPRLSHGLFIKNPETKEMEALYDPNYQ